MIKKMGKKDELMAELIVQKSRPLLTLWASQLSLYAFRLLDVYLTKIDMHDEASRTVVFYKQELEQILDVDRIRTEELDKILDTLLDKVQIVDKINGIKAKIKINLFETATTLEDETGVKMVKMECTQTAKKYFFNIEQIGYLKYKLKHITPLKSRYSYVLYTFLESNRFRPKFEIKIEKLKKILRCEKEEQYKEFKRFNDKVLKKAKDELEKKISYKFTYKTIKTGRNVTSIWFELAEFPTVKEIINMPAQTNMIREKEKDTKYQLKHVMSFNRICNHAHTKQTELENNLTTLKDNYSDICPELRGEKPKQPERTSDFEVTEDRMNELRRAIGINV